VSTSQEKALRKYRQRLKQCGVKRLELQATEEDALLLRKLAKILRDGNQESDLARTRLRAMVTQPATAKELLAAAPLEGIRITRSPDRGRIIEL